MNHIYEHLTFPSPSSHPYIFATFVSTLDGIAKVLSDDRYWPIGSDLDFRTFIGLRRFADVVIHGKETAVSVRTLDTIATQKLNENRKEPLLYAVVSNHPDESLLRVFQDPQGTKTMLVTSSGAVVPDNVAAITEVLRVGETEVDIEQLVDVLFARGYKYIDHEGGPRLFHSFLEKDLIDELFVTIAPKLYGHGETTITMLEGGLLPHDAIKHLEIISVKQCENELYLRYRVKK